jgi:osmoprotectant transport system permease protein
LGADKRSEDGLVDVLTEALKLLFDGSNWTGSMLDSGSILTRLWEHVFISVTSVALAVVVALPLGLYIGHRRRFELLVINLSNIGRALPAFAVLALAYTVALRWQISFEFWPAFIALFLLAIPPIVTNTYVGVKEVDADVVEAARGMGFSEMEVLRRVEIPLSLPLIVAGIRTSLVQVIATATLAAITAGGNFGRFIQNGFARQERPLILAGAILVASLAISAELIMALVEKAVRPRSSEAPDATVFDEVGLGPGVEAA